MPTAAPLPAPLLAASRGALSRAGEPELLVNRPAELALRRLQDGSDFASAARGGDRAAAHAEWRDAVRGTTSSPDAIAGYRLLRDQREASLGIHSGRSVHGSLQFRTTSVAPSTGVPRYGEVAFVATHDALEGARLLASDSFYAQSAPRRFDELAQVVAERALRSHDVVRDRGEASSAWNGPQLDQRRQAFVDALNRHDVRELSERVADVIEGPGMSTHYIETVTDGLRFNQIAEVRIDLPSLIRRLGPARAQDLADQLTQAATARSIPVTTHSPSNEDEAR